MPTIKAHANANVKCAMAMTRMTMRNALIQYGEIGRVQSKAAKPEAKWHNAAAVLVADTAPGTYFALRAHSVGIPAQVDPAHNGAANADTAQ